MRNSKMNCFKSEINERRKLYVKYVNPKSEKEKVKERVREKYFTAINKILLGISPRMTEQHNCCNVQS